MFAGFAWRLGAAGREFRYRSCAQQHLYFCQPWPTPAELEAYYASDFNYAWYAKRTLLKRIQGQHRWWRLTGPLKRRIASKGTLLDVGCGHGWFVKAARQAGWQAQGLDLPSAATRYAREQLGLPIVEGSIEGVDLPDQSYDVITLWHGLEHFIDPLSVLKSIRRLLKPAGRVVIAVPNLRSRGLARQGVQWVWLQQPFVHLWHFSNDSLAALLTEAGFKPEQTATYDTWDAQYWFDSVWLPKTDAPIFRRLARWASTVVDGSLKTSVYDEAYFYLSEFARLIGYGLYLPYQSLVRRDRGDGSELLMLATVCAQDQIPAASLHA
jgi:SAM-dependent methyltransferase